MCACADLYKRIQHPIAKMKKLILELIFTIVCKSLFYLLITYLGCYILYINIIITKVQYTLLKEVAYINFIINFISKKNVRNLKYF